MRVNGVGGAQKAEIDGRLPRPLDELAELLLLLPLLSTRQLSIQHIQFILIYRAYTEEV